MEDSKLREIGSWLPFNVEAWAFNTIGGLANATGQDLLGLRITTETVQTTIGPRTQMTLDYDAPVPEKNTATWSAVSRRVLRFENLKSVHEYFDSVTHREAVDNIQRAVNENRNLALYLRGFGLAAKPGYYPADHQLKIYSGQPVTGISIRQEDNEFQTAIVRTGIDLIVGIANPEDPNPSRTIPQLMLTNCPWVPTVKGLASRCVPIFVFMVTSSLRGGTDVH